MSDDWLFPRSSAHRTWSPPEVAVHPSSTRTSRDRDREVAIILDRQAQLPDHIFGIAQRDIVHARVE